MGKRELCNKITILNKKWYIVFFSSRIWERERERERISEYERENEWARGREIIKKQGKIINNNV